MKKYLYIGMSILGLLGFISLYVLVLIYKENEFPAIKYIIMIIGYISLILFMIGWLCLISKIKKGKNN